MRESLALSEINHIIYHLISCYLPGYNTYTSCYIMLHYITSCYIISCHRSPPAVHVQHERVELGEGQLGVARRQAGEELLLVVPEHVRHPVTLDHIHVKSYYIVSWCVLLYHVISYPIYVALYCHLSAGRRRMSSLWYRGHPVLSYHIIYDL
jgi:hypothetical protein